MPAAPAITAPRMIEMETRSMRTESSYQYVGTYPIACRYLFTLPRLTRPEVYHACVPESGRDLRAGRGPAAADLGPGCGRAHPVRGGEGEGGDPRHAEVLPGARYRCQLTRSGRSS